MEEFKLKLFKNIPGLSIIIGALLKVKRYKKVIDHAREVEDIQTEQKAILEACQIWSSKIISDLDITVNVIHPENLPKEGPVVFISNHQSYADILTFLYAIKNHQVGFIAKDSLEKIPVFGAWVKRIRGIFIHRGDARASLATINEGVDFLKKGFSLVIFPEGTRSRSSQMADFKPGSFKLATKAKVPLVPITIDGGYHTYEGPGFVKKGNTIQFLVHPPIDTASMDRHQLGVLPEQVEEIIREGLNSLTKNA